MRISLVKSLPLKHKKKTRNVLQKQFDAKVKIHKIVYRRKLEMHRGQYWSLFKQLTWKLFLILPKENQQPKTFVCSIKLCPFFSLSRFERNTKCFDFQLKIAFHSKIRHRRTVFEFQKKIKYFSSR